MGTGTSVPAEPRANDPTPCASCGQPTREKPKPGWYFVKATIRECTDKACPTKQPKGGIFHG